MAALPKPLAVMKGYVLGMAHVQPIKKKWQEGKADRLKVEMLDMHAKLDDNWCATPSLHHHHTTTTPPSTRKRLSCAPLKRKAACMCAVAGELRRWWR